MNECSYKEIVGVGNVTLMARVTGLEMSDRDPFSSFVTESAWPTWGVPLLRVLFPFALLFLFLSRLFCRDLELQVLAAPSEGPRGRSTASRPEGGGG